MLKFSVVCLYFAVAAVNFWNVHCISEDDKKAFIEAMKPIVEECGADCGLNENDFKKLANGDDMNPCFRKCLMQKIGFLNEDGKYDKKKLQDSILEYAGDKKQAQDIQDQLDSCFDANGDNDGDDEDSQMKRVDVLFKCLKEIKE